MWKNYLKIAWRNVQRNKLRSLIHVMGLSIGIAVSFLIFNIVFYSYSFDRFHPDGDRIFRVQNLFKWQDHSWDNPGVPFPLASTIQDSYTGVDEVGQIYALSGVEATSDLEISLEKSEWITFASPGLLEIFPRQWLAGNTSKALQEPNQVVLTASRAALYFPNFSPSDIVGREIYYLSRDTLTAQVVGIVADFKDNSDFQFTDYISLSTIGQLSTAENYQQDNWNSVNSNNQVFIKLSDGRSQEELAEHLAQLVDIHMEKEEDESTTFYLTPLSELHFNNAFNGLTANKETLRALVIIGFLLILMACLNFINLETAHAINRAKEVGIRKTLGSSRFQLLRQFLVETFLYVWISIFVSYAMIGLMAIYFSEFFPKGFEVQYLLWSNLLFMVALSVVLTLLSGTYPAWIMGSYSAHEALKKGWASSGQFSFGLWFRRHLTTIQFSISILFIIGILVIYKQMSYINQKHLGFDKEQVMYVGFPYGSDSLQLKNMRVAIDQLSFVEKTSWSMQLVSERSFWTSSLKHEKDSVLTEYNVQVKSADVDFPEVNGLKILAGRELREGAKECLVNRQFVKKLGFETPEEVVGEYVEFQGERQIVGVIEDFHSLNLKQSIQPLVFYEGNMNDSRVLNIRIAPNTGLEKAKNQVDAILKGFTHKDPIESKFLEDVITKLYEDEAKTSKVLLFATLITIIISCLGLFGLASWNIQKRIKEISIRKVLGANLSQILSLVSKEYVYLLLVSSIIGGGIAWYLSDKWLTNFVYRISMPWEVFILATITALFLSLAIVCYHALRAASKDPAEILKSE